MLMGTTFQILTFLVNLISASHFRFICTLLLFSAVEVQVYGSAEIFYINTISLRNGTFFIPQWKFFSPQNVLRKINYTRAKIKKSFASAKLIQVQKTSICLFHIIQLWCGS